MLDSKSIRQLKYKQTYKWKSSVTRPIWKWNERMCKNTHIDYFISNLRVRDVNLQKYNLGRGKWEVFHCRYGLIEGSINIPKYRNHLKIVRAIRGIWIKCHTVSQQILGANIQNLVAWTTCQAAFVHPWFNLKFPRAPDLRISGKTNY
jgi:hypothetical protein